ncbi:YwqG family protein [Cytobacillus firmus]|uniref:YwqG family protein n=1 Tax=Cytobacillus firmus TaxID=1399 RepID=A0AA46Q1B0_CYTFI|nr:YwqG family protein [Cytobacillus firmus]UYG93719.1 YwqG family protein [Cytobacillus firmus]
MTSLVLKLPKEFEKYRAELEKTAKPFVSIQAERGETTLLESKFGGHPYLPKLSDHPKDEQGNYMNLFAQINFEEVPRIEPMPESGILQFYLSPVDDLYGLDFDNPTAQRNYRVIYHPNIVKDEEDLVTDFSYVPDLSIEYDPIVQEAKMSFQLKIAPVPADDFRFEDMVNIDLFESIDHPDYEDLHELYFEELGAEGHKIGGYPYFTQQDPREKSDPTGEYTILLFQADTDDDIDLMFGDSGVANFFIKEEDLKNRNFTNVLYNWDCC